MHVLQESEQFYQGLQRHEAICSVSLATNRPKVLCRSSWLRVSGFFCAVWCPRPIEEWMTVCFQLVGETRGRCVSCPLCRGKCSSCSARHECLTGAGIFNLKPDFDKAAEPTLGRNPRPAHENFYRFRRPTEQPDGLSQGFAAVAISANPPHIMSWTWHSQKIVPCVCRPMSRFTATLTCYL